MIALRCPALAAEDISLGMATGATLLATVKERGAIGSDGVMSKTLYVTMPAIAVAIATTPALI